MDFEVLKTVKGLTGDPFVKKYLYDHLIESVSEEKIGELDNLTTEEKSNIVSAINELKLAIAENGGESGLITIVKDVNLVYSDGGTMFEYNIPNSAFPEDFNTTPYRYNIIVEVHGKRGDTEELFGYTANHFCYSAGPGDAFTALCHDMINEGISHDTMIVGGEEGYDVKYSGFYMATEGEALPLNGSKVSVYLQKLG